MPFMPFLSLHERFPYAVFLEESMGFRKCFDERKLPNLVTFESWGGGSVAMTSIDVSSAERRVKEETG